MGVAQMQKKLNVVFTVDKNYIQHFTVACVSLLENNFGKINRIMVICDFEDLPIFDSVLEFFKLKYNFKIEKYQLDSQVLTGFKISHHISKATYFRLLISEVLPKDLNKVLFLDSDIVVTGDISELADMDFKDNGYYVYAVDHNYTKDELERLASIGYRSNKYFNAGIMLINLEKWRKDAISNILLKNAKKYNDILLWWDQDVLNISFESSWGELDYTYNAFGITIKPEYTPKIIHYTGSSKPWHFFNRHHYKSLYWKYLKLTPFKYYFPEDLRFKNLLDILKKNLKFKT